MSKKFLVTGASGFVGLHLVEALLARGDSVRALVRTPGRAHELMKLPVEVVEGDLSSLDVLRAASRGADGIFHVAALFREAKLPDSAYFEVNVEGTRRVFEAAQLEGVPRVVYCSTNGVHGDVKHPPADESAPIAPCDVYQESKVQSEKVAQEYFSKGHVRGIILRPAMIWGPRDTRLFKIFKMVKKGSFFYVGPGRALCHFIDVRDLAQAFLAGMDRHHLNGEAYLIAGETIVPLCEVVDRIADMLGVSRPRLHLPLLPTQLAGSLCEAICKPFGIEPPLYRRRVDFFVKNRCFIVDKAKRDLDFRPARSFEEELKSIVEWYRSAGWL